jgi:hypothetical protein
VIEDCPQRHFIAGVSLRASRFFQQTPGGSHAIRITGGKRLGFHAKAFRQLPSPLRQPHIAKSNP